MEKLQIFTTRRFPSLRRRWSGWPVADTGTQRTRQIKLIQKKVEDLLLGSSGAPGAFKTWCGDQYRVGITFPPPLVEIGLRWLPKLGVDTSSRPHAHRRACLVDEDIEYGTFYGTLVV